MQQFSQFVLNHWGLWLAFGVLLITTIINELMVKKNSAKEISPQTLVSLINEDQASIFDLRDLENFQKGHIIQAKRVNPDDFSSAKMDAFKDKAFVLVCSKGLQSRTLAAKLRAQGFVSPQVLSGGIEAWVAAELPMVKGK